MKPCPRCRERVARVEQTSLGQVFMCTHGGSRYGNDGCRRTYLSQRDLQAHIHHRHLRMAMASADKEQPPPPPPPPPSPLLPAQKISTVPLSSSRGSQHSLAGHHLHGRSNLVSVTIQEPPVGLANASAGGYFNPPTSASSYSYSSSGHYAPPSGYYNAGYQASAPPPPQQQQQYDGSQSYANQWSASANHQSFYR